MEVKEILNKAKKLLKDNEYIYKISETPHYFVCMIADRTQTEELEGPAIKAIIIDKSSGNLKRPEHLSSSMYSLPISEEELSNKKTIYDVKDGDDEEIEKSTETTENGHEFDDLDLDKIFNDPANADIVNMVIDTNLKPEDLVENPQEETPQVENPQDDGVK